MFEFDSGLDTSSTSEMHLKRESLISDFFDLLAQIVVSMRNWVKSLKNLLSSPKKNKVDTAFKKSEDFEKKTSILEELRTKPTVNSLDEIAGIQDIKKTLYSLVILPRRQPQLFHNRSVNSILLFGPPGTGKTKLVHALAAQSRAQFYCVSLGDLMSSYLGETERNIQILFESLSNSEDFSMLFVDEIDGICRKRTSSDHDYSRRIKTQLMCQLSSVSHCKNLVVIAATNTPWELDSAILRRFQKRLYVPLPNKEERMQLFQLFTKDIPIDVQDDENLETLIEISQGFSGSDINTLVNDALDIPIMELEGTRIWVRSDDGFYVPYKPTSDCEIDTAILTKDFQIQDLNDFPDCSVKARTVSTVDFLKAAENVQPTVPCEEVHKYEQFMQREV